MGIRSASTVFATPWRGGCTQCAPVAAVQLLLLGFGIEPTGRHNDGCFIAVFNVAAFRSLHTFKTEVTEFAHYLKATPPAQGFTEVYYPGEIEYDYTNYRQP